MLIVETTDWAIGAPTIALAVLTGLLALATFFMARQSRAQVALEKERIEAAQQPNVFPAGSIDWSDGAGPYAGRGNEVIPLKNGGLGIARNVTGRLHFPDGAYIELVSITIAPGDTQDVRFNWAGEARGGSWADARGFLRYEDVNGVDWRTDFVYREEGPEHLSRRFIEVGQYGRVSDLRDPELDYVRPDVAD